MIAVNSAKGKRIALFGLGGSGLATARALKAGGAELYCHDDNPQSVAKATAEGLNTADLHSVDFSKIDELLLSPGVPLTHPKPHWTVELAQASGVPVIGDVELFAREWKAKAPESIFIAITGTNGKSTTTALIAHILRQAGFDVQLGGNIGTAVLSLDEPNATKAYVVECSSYQIDLAPSLAPSIGILLNLTPDHLDRHGDMENYSQIKARLVQSSQVAIVGCDDRFCAAIADSIDGVNGDRKKGDLIRIASEQSIENGIEFRDGKLLQVSNNKTSVLFDMMESQTLRGAHNGQNAAAAYAACRQAGLTGEQIADGLRSFAGLAHRMEQIGFVGQSLFVNDSKATNADAAARALSSFENIYWIVGGLAKEGGIEPLRSYFPKIKKAYLIGEAASAFSATLGNDVAFEISGTLAAATENASRDAATDQDNSPVILLSPACASFDQFPNFEVRGANFKAVVEALPGFVSLSDAFSNSGSNLIREITG